MPILVTSILFLLPGLAAVRREEWERAEPIELAGIAFAASAAFWAVSFWLLAFVPVSWRAFAVAVMAAALIGIAIGRRAALAGALAVWRRSRTIALAQASFIVSVLALRLAFAATHVAYSGGDMTAHAAMAEEIVMANGFPRTQEPLLPVPRFGEIAPGFHALSALVTLLTGLPTHRSTIYILCFAAAALSLALYPLLRALGLPRGGAAAGCAGAILLARNPQFFLQWGGAPSILAVAIGIVLLRDLLSLGQEPGSGPAVRAGVLGAGVFLVHPLPAVALVWIAVPLLLWQCLSGRGSWKNLARGAGVATLLALLLSLPFLAGAARAPSPETVSWARGWFRAETRGATELEQRYSPFPGRAPTLATWPFFLVSYLGALPVLLLAVGVARGFRAGRREAAATAVSILAVEALLFGGALGEFLPGWPALYPTRAALWVAVPLSIAVGELASWSARMPARVRVILASLFFVAFALEGWRLSGQRFGTAFYGEARSGRASVASLLANEAAGGAFWVATFCQDVAAVTGEDISAIAWVATHTPPGAVFANNPGDGGGLLPAEAHRKIYNPHYYWFFDKADIEAWRAKTPLDYVYVGAVPAPAWARRWTAEDLDRDARVELVHRSGRARIYRIREGFADSFR